jgi:hypothetical protein
LWRAGAYARARACARGNVRRENVKRARNARERARGSEATRRRAGARRVFSTSALTWQFLACEKILASGVSFRSW